MDTVLELKIYSQRFKILLKQNECALKYLVSKQLKMNQR